MYPTNRVECVYDRCAYRKCKNGRYYNGKHLFRFPVEKDPRHKVWIKNSGNHLLRVWSASTIRRSGLCEDHFTPDSFVNEKRQRLKRTAIPIPYSDVLEPVQKSIPKKVDDVNISPVHTKEETADINREESGKKEAIVSEQDYKVVKTEMLKEEDKIIEEDILVYEIYEEMDQDENTSQVQENREDENDVPRQAEYKIDDIVDTNVIWKNSLKRTYSARSVTHQITVDKDNPMECVDVKPLLPIQKDAVQSPKVSKASLNVKEVNDKDVLIDSLKKENNFLRQQMQLLKMKLRKNLSKTHIEKTPAQGREFLNKYLNELGLKPIAKAMVKLQLHNPNLPYTHDEKVLTKQLYYHSATALNELRKAGCNIPLESTIKNWIAEQKHS